VVDPFAGTGTTAVAALETGRHSVSVEIEPGYITLIEQRLASPGNLTAQIQIDRAVPQPAAAAKAVAR
jgi:site-specific DNA-methyltransferase (adenine-specific)